MTDRPAGDRIAIDPSIDAAGLFRAVLDSMEEAVIVVRPGDRVIVMTNPAAGRLFGVDHHSLVGRRTRVLYPTDEAFERFGTVSEELLNEGRSYLGQHEFRRGDGMVFEAEVTTAAIDPALWSDGVVSVLRDVSELQEARRSQGQLLHALNERVKELRGLHRTATILADHSSDLEEVFQRVVDNLPAAWQYPALTVASIDYRGIEVWSDGYCETEWILQESFVGRDGHEGRLTVCYVDAVADAEGAEPFLSEERDLMRSLAFLLGAQVKVREQRQHAERERDRFMTLFRNGPVAMALSEPEDGRFVDVNEHWSELSGYTAQELIGHTAIELDLWDTPEDREALKAELDRHGSRRGMEINYRRGGEEPRVGLMSVQVMELDGRKLWFTTLVDRTAEVRMAAEQAKLHEQKQALARLGAIGELAGGVAHDFNNLLLPIMINVDLLLPDLAGDARLRLEEIKEAAIRGRDLSRKLLAFGRRTEPHRESLRLEELVRSAEPILRRLVPESMEIELVFEGPGTHVSADPTLLEQVLMNLVINAADAIGGHGKIRIRTRSLYVNDAEALALERTGPDFDPVEPGKYVYLEVEDHGPGIPPEVQERMFEPFFTTKGESVGTGLGLASVIGIVKQHGGHIVVESELGVGTSFSVGLPVAAADAKEPDRDAQIEVARTGGGARVLVVEDHPAVRRATERALRAFAFEVTSVGDPNEALAALEAGHERFDVLVSDMVMPNMTGLELRNAMRERGLDLPTLFVSGYSGDVLSKHGVDRETIRILEKPFTPEALARATIAVIRGEGGESSP